MKLLKTLILKKTIVIISRDGIHNFSTKTVAKEAGCSEALIYHHFGTKRNLIDSCYSYISQKLQESLPSEYPADGDIMATIWGALLGFLGKDSDLARFILMYMLEINDGIPEGLEGLKDAISSRCKGMDPEYLEEFSVQATRTFVLTACIHSIDRSGSNCRFEEQYRGLLFQVADGISDCTPERSKTE